MQKEKVDIDCEKGAQVSVGQRNSNARMIRNCDYEV